MLFIIGVSVQSWIEKMPRSPLGAPSGAQQKGSRFVPMQKERKASENCSVCYSMAALERRDVPNRTSRCRKHDKPSRVLNERPEQDRQLQSSVATVQLRLGAQ
ncbi:hypothetical protein Kim5_PA00484 (plasmid) [Rhizobium sp. Kim5]|nr:hypothetical protein Kim5_PA00484 [Rhizobium sp. Kim5]